MCAQDARNPLGRRWRNWQKNTASRRDAAKVTFRVRITTKALTNAEDVLRWFHDQEADAAGARWYAGLLSRIDTLARHPDGWPLASEEKRQRMDRVGQTWSVGSDKTSNKIGCGP